MTQFANNLLSVTVPDGWVAAEHEDGSGLNVATSEAALRRHEQGATLQPGDQALVVSLIPAQLFQALTIEIEPGASPAALCEALLAKLAGADGADAAAPRVVALKDGRDVALRKATSERGEGAVLLFEIADGVLALSSVAASAGAYEVAEAQMVAILSSLAFDGTAKALTAAINPPPRFN